MEPSVILTNDALELDEFLCDVSMHLRRRDLRMLLKYVGINEREIDAVLYASRQTTGLERGLLTGNGVVVEGSSSVNFLEQRKKAMRTWWEYAANTKQRCTPSQQKIKVVESSSCSLPHIPENHTTVVDGGGRQTAPNRPSTPKLPPLAPRVEDKLEERTKLDERAGLDERAELDERTELEERVKVSDRGTEILEMSVNQLHPNIPKILVEKDDQLTSQEDAQTINQMTIPATVDTFIAPPLQERPQNTPPPSIANVTAPSRLNSPSKIPVVQVPIVEFQTESDELSQSTRSHVKTIFLNGDVITQTTVDRGQQTDITGDDVTPDQVAIHGSNVTLEELLRKLWRSLQSCGLHRVVEDIQQRWMIRIDTNHGRADMYPKMTWGTPLPPQTPFTYPPYKKIGHMAVMGSTMSIEAKPIQPPDGTSVSGRYYNNGGFMTSRSLILESSQGTRFMPKSVRERLRTRSAKSRGAITAISLDGTTVTSFPARNSWKLRTDCVRRKGATITIRVGISDVTLPTQPSTKWGASLHVSAIQIRERVARVFFTYVITESRHLSRAVDRVEKIRGLVIETVQKRIGGGGTGAEIPSSEVVFVCRCLYPETVEQLWLLYQSSQLSENIHAALATRKAQEACAIENLRLRVTVAEDEYRRALGLLRRKPMPNTKTGRFYVTAGSGGSGFAHAQNQALMSVTRYLKLPTPAADLSEAPPPVPPVSSMATNKESKRRAWLGEKGKTPVHLINKVLNKELEVIKKRLRACETEWCNYAAVQLPSMLHCAHHVMQRRVIGATQNAQLTPRCTALSMLRSLYKAIRSERTGSVMVTPRGHHPSSGAANHSNIALYPSDVTFSNVDLVTSSNDDDDVVKKRKQEEVDFVVSYVTFTDLLVELGSCRAALQEKIIARMTTNPAVAPSRNLYLAKDIYNLMERWRHLQARDFNYSTDDLVQRLSSRLVKADEMTPIEKDVEDQFRGLPGLLPSIFRVADQVTSKLSALLPKSNGPTAPKLCSYVATPRGGSTETRNLSLWLSA